MPKGNGRPIPKVEVSRKLSSNQAQELLKTLRSRFEKNMNRHKDLEWKKIETKLNLDKDKLTSLFAMEMTGGEPDVIGYDKEQDEYLFCDCSSESPNRRSICYDREGEEARTKKGIFPGGNAIDIAEKMGVEVLDENDYRELQKLGNFDTKTSVWLKTPQSIRNLGGAIFGDFRYGQVFVYHNGAQSFYSDRGFRGLLRI